MPRRRRSLPQQQIEPTSGNRQLDLLNELEPQEGGDLETVLGMLSQLYGLQEGQEKLSQTQQELELAREEAPYKHRLMGAEASAYERRGGQDLYHEFETLMGIYGRPDEKGVMRLPNEMTDALMERHFGRRFSPPTEAHPAEAFTAPTGKTAAAADPSYDKYATDPEFAALMPQIEQRKAQQSAAEAERRTTMAAAAKQTERQKAMSQAKRAAGLYDIYGILGQPTPGEEQIPLKRTPGRFNY